MRNFTIKRLKNYYCILIEFGSQNDKQTIDLACFDLLLWTEKNHFPSNSNNTFVGNKLSIKPRKTCSTKLIIYELTLSFRNYALIMYKLLQDSFCECIDVKSRNIESNNKSIVQ